MENQNLKNLRLKNLFATHPSVNRFYFTSDDTPFIEQHHAQAHAQTLKDKSVQPYSRILLEAIENAKAKLASGTASESPVEKTTEAPKQDEPVNTEISALDSARTEFELVTGKPAGNRKLETLLAQIAEAKKEVTTK